MSEINLTLSAVSMGRLQAMVKVTGLDAKGVIANALRLYEAAIKAHEEQSDELLREAFK